MSRFRGIKGRLGRAEGGGEGDGPPVPTVLRVSMNETKAEAFARFNAEFPHRKPGHNVLCVPAKPANDAERALWAERFHARQLALVSAARRERIAIVKPDQSAPHMTPKIWPNSPTIRPNGPHVTWKRNTHD